MTKYVKNEEGGVHSVTDEHFEKVLQESTPSGNKYLLHGWTEIKESEARKHAPQLFGTPDPRVVMTSKEIKEVRDRRAFEAEIAAEEAGEADQDDATDTDKK